MAASYLNSAMIPNMGGQINISKTYFTALQNKQKRNWACVLRFGKIMHWKFVSVTLTHRSSQRRCLEDCNFIKKRLQQMWFLVKFSKFFRTLILKNICERLLLDTRELLKITLIIFLSNIIFS